METILYNHDMRWEEGFRAPVNMVTFSHVDGDTIISISFNFKPPPEMIKRLGLLPILQGQPCCGWFLYKATIDISQLITT